MGKLATCVAFFQRACSVSEIFGSTVSVSVGACGVAVSVGRGVEVGKGFIDAGRLVAVWVAAGTVAWVCAVGVDGNGVVAPPHALKAMHRSNAIPALMRVGRLHMG